MTADSRGTLSERNQHRSNYYEPNSNGSTFRKMSYITDGRKILRKLQLGS